MKITLVAFATALTLGLSAQAGVLKLEPGTKSNNGINVSKGGTATVDGKTYDVTTVGAGLRSKKVLLANVKVYVAQLLVSSPERFSHKDDDALKSLDDSQTVAIQMTFLRSVDAAKVQVSFREALDVNKVNTGAEDIKKFLAAVNNGGDANADKALTIVISKNSDGSETLVYEDTAGHQTVVAGTKGLTQKIFAIWLGVPSDDGVSKLKNDLIHGSL
jgi:hypothetical protein